MLLLLTISYVYIAGKMVLWRSVQLGRYISLESSQNIPNKGIGIRRELANKKTHRKSDTIVSLIWRNHYASLDKEISYHLYLFTGISDWNALPRLSSDIVCRWEEVASVSVGSWTEGTQGMWRVNEKIPLSLKALQGGGVLFGDGNKGYILGACMSGKCVKHTIGDVN